MIGWAQARDELLTLLWEWHLSELTGLLHVQGSTMKRCHKWLLQLMPCKGEDKKLQEIGLCQFCCSGLWGLLTKQGLKPVFCFSTWSLPIILEDIQHVSMQCASHWVLFPTCYQNRVLCCCCLVSFFPRRVLMYVGNETDEHHINYTLHMSSQLPNMQELLVIAVPCVAAFHWLA